MSIIVSEKIPKDGHFVVMWQVGNKLFSATCDFDEYHRLRSYNSNEDCWETEHGMGVSFFERMQAKFFQFVY